MITFNKKDAPAVFAFLTLAQAIMKSGDKTDTKHQHTYLTEDKKLVVTDSLRMAVFDFADYPDATPGYYKVIKVSSDLALIPAPEVTARYPDYSRVIYKVSTPIAERIDTLSFSQFFCQTLHLVEGLILDIDFVKDWYKFLETTAASNCLVCADKRNYPVQFETPECRYIVMPIA